MPSKERPRSSSTLRVEPLNERRLPAERAEASSCIPLTGNRRCYSTRSISVPTAPVAPTTATLYPFLLFIPNPARSSVIRRFGGRCFFSSVLNAQKSEPFGLKILVQHLVSWSTQEQGVAHAPISAIEHDGA